MNAITPPPQGTDDMGAQRLPPLKIIPKPRGFEANEKWHFYREHLPGFALMAAATPNVAYTIYKTTGLYLKKGFVQLSSEDGSIAFSEVSKKAYLYKAYTETFLSDDIKLRRENLLAIAMRLTRAAGWKKEAQIQDRGFFNAGSTALFYAQEADFEDEIAAAERQAQEDFFKNHQPSPVDETAEAPLALPYHRANPFADMSHVTPFSVMQPDVGELHPIHNADGTTTWISQADFDEYIRNFTMPESNRTAANNNARASSPFLLPPPSDGFCTGNFSNTRNNASAARIADRVVDWAKKHAPGLIAGGIAGASVRIGGQFALAKLAIALPGFAAAVGAAPVAAAIVSAVVLGAFAGGVAKVVTTSISGGDLKQQPHWRKKAFLKGMKSGAVGGVIGLGVSSGIAELFRADGILHGLWQGHSTPANAPAGVMQPTGTAPQPGVSAPQPAAPVPPVAAPAPSTVPPHVDVPPATVIAPSLTDGKLISPEVLKSLPKDLQRLALSKNPKSIIHFCKEASFILMHGAHHTHDTAKVGVDLMNYGLKVAEQNGILSHTVRQLHADEAYVNAYGIGTGKNIPEAIRHAKLAGHAIHNFGGKMLRAFARHQLG